MKLLQSLKNCVEPNNAIFGFGFVRAKDYDRDRYGHLFIFSFRYKNKSILKKLFIPI